MHEAVHVVALFVKELVGTALHVGEVDFHAGGKGVLQDTAGAEVFQFAAHESGTLARFNVLEFDDGPKLTVQFYVQSVLKICSCCHKTI